MHQLLHRPLTTLILSKFTTTTILRRLLSPSSVMASKPAVNVGGDDGVKVCPEGLAALRLNLEKEGIQQSPFEPGKYKGMMCPKCGGKSKEKRFSLFVGKDGQFAAWSCGDKCGWKGTMQASGESKSFFASEEIPKVNINLKDKRYRVISEEELHLAPLGKEALQYMSSRGISHKTLQRNAVMQRVYKNKVDIAFTYRRNGSLVSCKFRSIKDKKFSQERDTERLFYGLDDIKQATDIIIVEGEIDKLALDEAGYSNCVSVPDGANGKVSVKLPSEDEDTQFQYVWKAKEYLGKASRIVLATDADPPGQALAEELARRVGKERCWRVKWPDKNGTEVCKDANEVLMYLGQDALKEVIENAERYDQEVI